MTARLHAAPFDEALEALQFFTGWAGGWTPIERRRADRTRLYWRNARAPGLPALIRDLDDRYGDEIAFGLPQTQRWNGGVTHATILWARIEGSVQLRWARNFRPLPTIVLQEGASSRRLLIWALEEAVRYFDLIATNKRIAYRLRARQCDGDPDRLWVPCPGTCLLTDGGGRKPVRTTRLTMQTFTVKQVAGRLKDPPEQKDWRTA